MLLRGINYAFQNIILSPNLSLCGDTVNKHYKGLAAIRIGASIMVDDDLCHQEGCIQNDIEFLHLPCEESKSIGKGLFGI
jgi:hypothetical protein